MQSIVSYGLPISEKRKKSAWKAGYCIFKAKDSYICTWLLLAQHPGCRFASVPKTNQQYWLPKLRRNCERDKANCEKLRELGWNVAVVWECEIKKNLQQAAENIYNLLSAGTVSEKAE